MARILSLVMAGMLLCRVGCATAPAEVDDSIWDRPMSSSDPQDLGLDAYADVHPTVATAKYKDVRVAIAGGRIIDHGVYIDVLIEMPIDAGSGLSVVAASYACLYHEDHGERWFKLSHPTGEQVLVHPRAAPPYVRDPHVSITFVGDNQLRLNAAPGLRRYYFVAWYNTGEQLRPGTYILHVPNIFDEYPGIYREQLGLKAFDNTAIELRYADGFTPAAAGG